MLWVIIYYSCFMNTLACLVNRLFAAFLESIIFWEIEIHGFVQICDLLKKSTNEFFFSMNFHCRIKIFVSSKASLQTRKHDTRF